MLANGFRALCVNLLIKVIFGNGYVFHTDSPNLVSKKFRIKAEPISKKSGQCPPSTLPLLLSDGNETEMISA